MIAEGEPVERYGLQEDGQGVANPATARKYELNGMLAHPLWSEGRLLGYLNHFSSKLEHFTATDKKLLEIFARQAVISIERLKQEPTREHHLETLEQRRADVLERIMHELRAPASALKSDVSYLKRKFAELPEHRIQNKLDDLALDAELVLLQVSKVEHFLGGASPPSRPQRTVVYRDIIIKTLNQLKRRITESGYDASKIHYNAHEIGRVVLFLDPVRLSQVVFNLLINAIKYAEDDPGEFAVRIDLDETRDHFILKFKDWGIGIKKEFEGKIFELGFRAPQAKARFITGSGLGLTISRELMRGLGGDLRLASNYKPTEFHLVLPKSLKGMPR